MCPLPTREQLAIPAGFPKASDRVGAVIAGYRAIVGFPVQVESHSDQIVNVVLVESLDPHVLGVDAEHFGESPCIRTRDALSLESSGGDLPELRTRGVESQQARYGGSKVIDEAPLARLFDLRMEGSVDVGPCGARDRVTCFGGDALGTL
jgi:hypothetical protein